MEGESFSRVLPKPYRPEPSSSAPSEYKFQFSSKLETQLHHGHEDNKPTFYDQDFLNKQAGLYDKTTNIIGDEAPDIHARLTALQASSFIVSIIASYPDLPTLRCSGIIIQHEGRKMILTSGYILGDSSKSEVDIILPNQIMLKGSISITDKKYNIVLIDATKLDSYEMKDCARFTKDVVKLSECEHVTAVGRDSDSDLKASTGRVDIRGDHLECDDLLSSSCSISEWGVGGPLIDDTGFVIGMNFFSRKGCTPFLPSVILVKCIEFLLKYGVMFYPYLGLKLRSLGDEKSNDFCAFFRKYECTEGLVVKEVISGSPANVAGIGLHDVIISCEDTQRRIWPCSPPEFTRFLFHMLTPITLQCIENLASVGYSIEVEIYSARTGAKEKKTISDFKFCLTDSLNIERWPTLPPVLLSFPGYFSQEWQ